MDTELPGNWQEQLAGELADMAAATKQLNALAAKTMRTREVIMSTDVMCASCSEPLVPGIGEESAQWRTAHGGRYFCRTSTDALHHPVECEPGMVYLPLSLATGAMHDCDRGDCFWDDNGVTPCPEHLAELCEGCYRPLNGMPSPCADCSRNAW